MHIHCVWWDASCSDIKERYNTFRLPFQLLQTIEGRERYVRVRVVVKPSLNSNEHSMPVPQWFGEVETAIERCCSAL
jgi:hypothetical protein